MAFTEGKALHKTLIKLMGVALAIAIAFVLLTYGCAKSEQNDARPAGKTSQIHVQQFEAKSA